MQVFPGFGSLYSSRTQWYGCKTQPKPRQRLSESYTDCFSSSFTYLSIYSYTWVCWCFGFFFLLLLPSPCPRQTRSLLSVFEEDAGMLTNYTNQLLQSLQRVFGAQVLSKHTQTDICKRLFPLQSVNGPQTFNTRKSNGDGRAAVGCRCLVVSLLLRYDRSVTPPLKSIDTEL